ncbi:MAG: hypothetical protein GY743_20250, partial [Planctomycetaceae bacterium]|nr:hypothetical protein [Planctomycetaceae bacterium]
GPTDFTFTVTRSGDTSGTATASYDVTSGASDAIDFGGGFPSGTVSFASGETTQTITISVSGDTDVESDEDFTVTLSSPTGATISTATATGTIQNDDATLAIAPLSADKPEGDSGPTDFTFTVTRSGDTSGTATASYDVTSGASDAIDFGGGFPSGTVSFASGETTQTVTVSVSGDTAVEPDEDFTVTLSSPTGATISTATATGT